MKASLLILGLLAMSCSSDKSVQNPPKNSDKSSDASGEASKERVVAIGEFKYNIKPKTIVSDAEIVAIEYTAESHSVSLELEYKACADVLHSLVFSDACAESYPRKCGATLSHSEDVDTSCSEKRSSKLKVDLSSDQDELYLFVANSSGKSKSVLVDKTGRVKEMTSPTP